MRLPFLFSFFPFLLILSSAYLYYPKGYSDDKNLEKKDGDCRFAIDVLNLIDTTESQAPKVNAIQESVIKLNHLIKKFADGRFGLVTFKDKPIPPRGYNSSHWHDYCIDITTDFTDNLGSVEREVKKLRMIGGFDFAEGQFDAIIRAIVSTRLNWREKVDPVSGKTNFKLLILATDSISHMPGDAAEAAQSLTQDPNNIGNPVKVPRQIHSVSQINDANSSPNKGCAQFDYPPLSMVADVIKRNRIIPVFLLAPAKYKCHEHDAEHDAHCSFPQIARLANITKDPRYLHPMKGLRLVYESYLDQMGVIGIIEEVNSTFDSFNVSVQNAISTLYDSSEYCNFDKSTSAELTASKHQEREDSIGEDLTPGGPPSSIKSATIKPTSTKSNPLGRGDQMEDMRMEDYAVHDLKDILLTRNAGLTTTEEPRSEVHITEGKHETEGVIVSEGAYTTSEPYRTNKAYVTEGKHETEGVIGPEGGYATSEAHRTNKAYVTEGNHETEGAYTTSEPYRTNKGYVTEGKHETEGVIGPEGGYATSEAHRTNKAYVTEGNHETEGVIGPEGAYTTSEPYRTNKAYVTEEKHETEGVIGPEVAEELPEPERAEGLPQQEGAKRGSGPERLPQGGSEPHGVSESEKVSESEGVSEPRRVSESEGGYAMGEAHKTEEVPATGEAHKTEKVPATGEAPSKNVSPIIGATTSSKVTPFKVFVGETSKYAQTNASVGKGSHSVVTTSDQAAQFSHLATKKEISNSTLRLNVTEQNSGFHPEATPKSSTLGTQLSSPSYRSVITKSKTGASEGQQVTSTAKQRTKCWYGYSCKDNVHIKVEVSARNRIPRKPYPRSVLRRKLTR